MGVFTSASISMIKNTVKVNSLGRTAAATMVNGNMASNMVKESICKRVENVRVSGKTANALIGSRTRDSELAQSPEHPELLLELPELVLDERDDYYKQIRNR